MRPYRLIFYFFKCYLDRVQYHVPVHRFDGFIFNRRGNRNGDGHDVHVGRYFCRGLWNSGL